MKYIIIVDGLVAKRFIGPFDSAARASGYALNRFGFSSPYGVRWELRTLETDHG